MPQSPDHFYKLPGLMQDKILCLEEWKEPEGFREKNANFRKQLQAELRSQQVRPTESNYWVWFGSYPLPRALPRYNQQQVSRFLLKHFELPLLDGKRVVNYMSPFASDVNPFKMRLGNGEYRQSARKLPQGIEYVRAVNGETTNVQYKKGSLYHKDTNTAPAADVAACVFELKDGGYEGIPTASLKQMMLHSGYTPAVIERALQELGW